MCICTNSSSLLGSGIHISRAREPRAAAVLDGSVWVQSEGGPTVSVDSVHLQGQRVPESASGCQPWLHIRVMWELLNIPRLIKSDSLGVGSRQRYCLKLPGD